MDIPLFEECTAYYIDYILSIDENPTKEQIDKYISKLRHNICKNLNIDCYNGKSSTLKYKGISMPNYLISEFLGEIENSTLSNKERSIFRKVVFDYIASNVGTELEWVNIGTKYPNCKCDKLQQCMEHNVCMCYASTNVVIHCGKCKESIKLGKLKRNFIKESIFDVLPLLLESSMQ